MIVQRTAFALMAGAALAVTTLASPATGWADEADQGVADSALAPACPNQVFDSVKPRHLHRSAREARLGLVVGGQPSIAVPV